jgi:hypothetical protein
MDEDSESLARDLIALKKAPAMQISPEAAAVPFSKQIAALLRDTATLAEIFVRMATHAADEHDEHDELRVDYDKLHEQFDDQGKALRKQQQQQVELRQEVGAAYKHLRKIAADALSRGDSLAVLEFLLPVLEGSAGKEHFIDEIEQIKARIAEIKEISSPAATGAPDSSDVVG